MRKFGLLFFLLFFSQLCLNCYPVEELRQPEELKIICSETIYETGVLKALSEKFKNLTQQKVKLKTLPFKEILKSGKDQADLILVEDLPLTQEWLKKFSGLKATPVLADCLLLLGPLEDPARIKGLDFNSALKKVWQKKPVFVAPEENSALGILEKSLWVNAGLSPENQDWYKRKTAALLILLFYAHDYNAYIFAPRSVYLKARADLKFFPISDQKLNFSYLMVEITPKAVKFATFLSFPDSRRFLLEFGKSDDSEPFFLTP